MQQEMAMSTMRKNRDARDGVGWVEGDHEGREGTLEFKELRDDITAQDMAERKIIAQGIYADLALKLESFTIESQQVQSNTDNVVIGTSVNITDDFSYPNASGSLNVSVNASGYASELLDVVDGSGIA